MSITIFIPVLFICLNSNCEFMQAQAYYPTEKQCRASLDTQKLHMQTLVKKTEQGKAEILQGACIEAEIKTLKGEPT